MRLTPHLACLGVVLTAAATSAAPPPAASAAPPASAAPAPPPPPPPPTGDLHVPNDQVQTTVLPDGVVLTFEPGTTGRWQGAGKLASETAKWTRGFHVELTDGEMDITMPVAGKGEHAFLVSTRAGTLTDWRGRMHVMARGDTTSVVVYDGAVVVGSNRQSFPVTAATALVLHKGGDADKSHPVPPVPSWDGAAAGGPPSFAVVAEGTNALLGLAWAPASGAASYRVQVGTDAEMSHIVQSAAVGEPHFSLPAPAAGVHYWAQVRSVGAEGIVGAWSAPRALRVLHYRLPSGAFVARDGVVVLPDGTSLPLTDADGIEISYENLRPDLPPPSAAPSLYWSKLGGPLRLTDDAPMRVAHLRDPGLGVETRVVLARRQLRAEVTLQPTQAQASDPLDVRAVVFDPTGRVDLASESITLEAMVDLDPVAVAWQHANEATRSVWTGRIGPRRFHGPSVVRVVVKDGLGQEIGRGFVEIAR